MVTLNGGYSDPKTGGFRDYIVLLDDFFLPPLEDLIQYESQIRKRHPHLRGYTHACESAEEMYAWLMGAHWHIRNPGKSFPVYILDRSNDGTGTLDHIFAGEPDNYRFSLVGWSPEDHGHHPKCPIPGLDRSRRTTTIAGLRARSEPAVNNLAKSLAEGYPGLENTFRQMKLRYSMAVL